MQQKLFYSLGIVIALSVLVFMMLPNTENQSTHRQTNDMEPDAEIKHTTIANAWQWDAGADSDEKISQISAFEQHNETYRQLSLPFTEASVYNALHAVKLDDNGDIILDDDALNALNSTLDNPDVQLTDEGLSQLQGLIKKGLPGSAGEQTAQVVADFYQYLGAKNAFNALYESSMQADQTVEQFEAQYDELNALREVYLGSDASHKLFAVSNANARYMFESMKLEANQYLSDAEKQQQQTQLIEEHEAETISVNDWNARYQVFLNDKQYIIDSSLSENQKRSQLSELMRQHFTVAELEAVSHLQLGSL